MEASTAAHAGGGSNPTILQFVSIALSQRGPTSLPYPEDVKWLIRQHLVSLSDAFPSLQPKIAAFTHNDGRSVNLLQSDGTVPVSFHGATYNIPVVVWLVETYPRLPPCVYVNPTRDMFVKRPHPHVDPSGFVSIPYLQNWIYPSSNLVDLARNLSFYFSRDPPLFSQRSPSVNPNPNFPPKEVFRRNATEKLVEKAHGDIVELKKARETQMETQSRLQKAMILSQSKIDFGLKEMQDEIERLEQELQMVSMDCDVLQTWLRENGGKKNMGSLATVDVDAVIEPCDVLSKQVMECSNADLAIEDVIDALDKAVQEGVIPFDQYLKKVRLLSREQFLRRATAAKAGAAQMQARVGSMAARAASQYAR